MFLFFIFLLGLIVGSFLNSVIHRLFTNESFSFALTKKKALKVQRSYCPKCRHLLGWRDLIPVLSFIALGARCRYCKAPISWQYPLVELATGLLFVFVWQLGLGFFLTLFYLAIVCLLTIAFVFDLKHYLIPDKVTYFLIGIVFLHNILMFLSASWGAQAFLRHLLSAISSLGFLGLIFLISKGRWMGLGDVKIAFFMGLLLGFPNILAAFFISFSIGAIVGCFLIVLGKKGLKSEIPFGPFLAFGTFVSMFWAEGLIRWYLAFFY